MPLRYHLRRARPPSIAMRDLLGEKTLSGDIFLKQEQNYYKVITRLSLVAGEILGFYAPSARYYMNTDVIPSFKYNELSNIVVLKRIDTKECLLLHMDKDFHFSLFLKWTLDEIYSNCTINRESQIVVTKTISCNQELICYCDNNIWERLDPMTLTNVKKAKPLLDCKTSPYFPLADTSYFQFIQ